MAEIVVYIAIGSNLLPYQHVPQSIELLAEIPQTRILTLSSWYRTAPWGLDDQSDIEDKAEFINLVVEVATALAPHDLLRATQEIEQRLGRVRTRKNGARTIDLDLLLYGSELINDDALSIPHPGLLERDFMLLPLLEISPLAVDPNSGLPLGHFVERIHYRQIIARI
jgi:2-amino-4-hydroxy-6-hydroxymethyldihydropteridine diphosphokinase